MGTFGMVSREQPTAKSTAQSTSRLLDRDDCVTAIDSALSDAISGNGRVLLIEGPPGIGKTALLRVLRERAHRHGLQILSARGGQLETGFAFGVVRQLFEPAVAAAERDELFGGAARLAEPLFSGSVTTGAGDTAFATLHGLYWLVANLAERGPLAMIVDDVFWSDVPSIRFLLYLANRIVGMPVLLTITSRTGADRQSEVLRGLLLEAQPPIVRPAPLSDAAVHQLMIDTIGDRAVPGVDRALVEATGGNPFLLIEVLGEFRRQGAAHSHITAADVPLFASDRIAQAVLHRVNGLDPQAPAFARAVAALGDDAFILHSAALAELEPDHARRIADGLVELAVLVPGEPLRFVHPVVRAAIYENMPSSHRAQLHHRAATVLEDNGVDVSRFAVHYLECDPAGDPRVVSGLTHAAARAMSEGAPETAVAFLRRALNEPPPRSERAAVLFELGRAEHTLSDPEAADHLREAGLTASDPVGRARALLMLAANTHTNPQRQREQIELYEQAADDVEAVDRELALNLRGARLSGLLFNPSLEPRFEDEADRYVDLLPDSPGACFIRSFLGRRALAASAGPEAVTRIVESAVSDPAFVSRDVHPVWRANVAFCLVEVEQYAMADELLSRTVRHARSSGSPQWLTRTLFLRASARHRAGDLRGAESDGREALDIGLAQQNVFYIVLTSLTDSLVDQGRAEEAHEIVVSRGLDGQLPPAITSIIPLVTRGRMHSALGHVSRARTDLEDAIDRIKRYRFLVPGIHDARVALVPVLIAAGNDTAARQVATEALADAEKSGLKRAIGGALRVNALFADRRKALELLHRASTILQESPALLWRAEALLAYGAALQRDRQLLDAREVLREALELAHRCGAAPLADHAAHEMRLAGGRVRRRSGTGAAALTSGERRAAELAAAGMTNKEIAQTLFVTLRTVEMHLSNAYAKLAIRTRSELSDALAG